MLWASLQQGQRGRTALLLTNEVSDLTSSDEGWLGHLWQGALVQNTTSSLRGVKGKGKDATTDMQRLRCCGSVTKQVKAVNSQLGLVRPLRVFVRAGTAAADG